MLRQEIKLRRDKLIANKIKDNNLELNLASKSILD